MFYERKRKSLIWLIVLIIAVVFLKLTFFKTTSLLDIPRNLAISVIYPFQYITKATYNGIIGSFANLINLRSAQKDNRTLKEELSLLKAKVNSFDAMTDENERLRQALGYRSSRPYGYSMIYAEVVLRSASNWFNTVEIDKGIGDGIKTDMAVVTPDGLVGKIIEVYRFSSKVLLITDPSSGISAADQRTRDIGIAMGGSIGPLQMKYVSTNADIKEGDIIVTSGMSEIFPRGIRIGKVRSVSKKDYDLFQKVTISPAVNLSRLESVYVVVR